MLNILLALALTGNPGVNPGIKPAPAASSQVNEGKEIAGSKTIVFNGQEYRVSIIEIDTDLAKALEENLSTVGNPKRLDKWYENPELPFDL